MPGQSARRAIAAVVMLAIGVVLVRIAGLGPAVDGLLDGVTPTVAERTQADTLRQDETLDLLLRRGGLDGAAIIQIVNAAPMLDPRRMRPGMPVEFVRDDESMPATEIRFKLAIDHLVYVTRVDSARWDAREERLPWITDTVTVHGAVVTNLYDALRGLALDLFPGVAHNGLVLEIADVYKYRVDMSRELHAGDSVYAVVERSRGPESTTKVARVLATRLFVAGRPIEAFYYQTPASRNVYYDASGKSLATAFLHSPIEFARITSGFGSRFHPILRTRRAHRGVDYGASQGTPVNVIGDGTVIRAWNDPGGFGNVVEVRHPNGFVSRYAHLSRFSAKGRTGTRVMQGDVIGSVGMTGLATAPHLHFEILVRGQQTSPSASLRNVDGTPLPTAARPGFDRERSVMLALLARVPGVVSTPRTSD